MSGSTDCFVGCDHAYNHSISFGLGFGVMNKLKIQSLVCSIICGCSNLSSIFSKFSLFINGICAVAGLLV